MFNKQKLFMRRFQPNFGWNEEDALRMSTSLLNPFFRVELFENIVIIIGIIIIIIINTNNHKT